MAWRKWIVRSLVFTVAAAVAGLWFVYEHWTDPTIVRQEVIRQLEERLTGAHVHLESAHLKLLGGIAFHDLRFVRRDDPKKTEFIRVPYGTIYPDKERLYSGQVAIRLIEWEKPTIRVIRRADGTWNLAHVLAPPSPEIAIPTIVLKNAKFIFEDEQAGLDPTPLVIKDVELTILNDPHEPPRISMFTFKGSARCDMLGQIQVAGTLARMANGRLADDLTASITLPKFRVDRQLLERLARYWPEATAHFGGLTGDARLHADLAYHPKAAHPWTHDVRLALSKGTLQHPRLPLPLEDLEAEVRCNDGQVTLEKGHARAGTAQVSLTGKMLQLAPDADFEGHLQIEHLVFRADLLALLPDKLHDLQHDYDPKGSFSIVSDFERRQGEWSDHTIIEPEEASGSYHHFRYRVDRIRGRVEHELRPATKLHRVTIDVRGSAGGKPILVRGSVNCTSAPTFDLAIRGQDVPINEQLLAALRPEHRKIVDSFRPTGLTDVEARVQRSIGDDHVRTRILVHVHDVTAQYEVFPYPVEGVSGIVDIQPDHWEFRDFVGTHQGGEFRAHGGSSPSGSGKPFTITITGKNVLLDEEMHASLKKPALEQAWKTLAPEGRINFTAQVEQFPNAAEPDIEVSVVPLGAGIRPEFFRYALTDLRGTVTYRRQEVLLQKLSARHGPTILTVNEGKITLGPGNTLAADIVDLVGNPVVPDTDLLRALPPGLARTCEALHLRDPVALRTNLTIQIPTNPETPPIIFWDGGLRLKDASLEAGIPLERVNGLIFCRGRHQGAFGNVLGNVELDEVTIFKQTLRDLHSQIIVRESQPDLIEMANLKARLFGGDLGGTIRVAFGSTLQYEVNLTAAQARLEELAKQNRLGPEVELRGLAAARLYVRGQGNDLASLEGGGDITVPNGAKIYNLRPFLDLLKLLSLHAPDKTAFEEAQVRFTLRGPRVDITQLDLFGNAVSLSGKGWMKYDGTDLNLDFYAVWARIHQWAPPGIDKIPGLLSKYLFLKIKMRGQIGKVEVTKEPVPIVLEPVKALLKRMSGKEP